MKGTLITEAVRLLDEGWDPVLIKPEGCKYDENPHVCHSCKN